MKFFVLLSCIALTILSCGCTNPWMTNTGRSAIEQYLISATIERAVDSAGLMRYSGKKIFFDYNYLAPQVDKPYVQGMLEMELSKVGCIIVAKQEEADIMIQPLCGVLATDHDSWMIGTPPPFPKSRFSKDSNAWLTAILPSMSSTPKTVPLSQRLPISTPAPNTTTGWSCSSLSPRIIWI